MVLNLINGSGDSVAAGLQLAHRRSSSVIHVDGADIETCILVTWRQTAPGGNYSNFGPINAELIKDANVLSVVSDTIQIDSVTKHTSRSSVDWMGKDVRECSTELLQVRMVEKLKFSTTILLTDCTLRRFESFALGLTTFADAIRVRIFSSKIPPRI